MNETFNNPKIRKAFTRFKIKSKPTNHHQSYKQPHHSYFTNIKSKDLLNIQDNINVNDSSKNTQNQREVVHNHVNSFIQNQIKLDQYYKSHTPFHKTTKEHIKSASSNQPSKLQKTERSRAITQGNLHLNYIQYEKLIQKIDIDPSYFEKIATRNDNKYQSILQITQTIAKYMLTMQKKDKKQPISKNISVKIKPKTVQQNIIAGTKLGANSLKQIRQKLQQKWDKQQKQILQKNTHDMSDQSQNQQIKKTSQLTMRHQVINKGKIQLKNKKDSSISVINWDKIVNKKYKQSLRTIFEKKKGSKIEEETYNQNEYSNRQASLLKFNNIYKQKKFILKHKIEWKV